MPTRNKKQTTLNVRAVRPFLPGPWQYLDLLQMLSLVQTRLRDAPALAYPLLALIIWRTVTGERRKRTKAILQAHREAIRRSQQIWVVKPKRRRRFLLF